MDALVLSCGIGKLLCLFELLTLLGYARPVLLAILGWGGGGFVCFFFALVVV